MMPDTDGASPRPQGENSAHEDCGSDDDWRNTSDSDLDRVDDWAYSNDCNAERKDCFSIAVWNARSLFKQRDEIKDLMKAIDILIVCEARVSGHSQECV